MNMKKLKDAELIQKLNLQDEAAFNELYARYHKLVYYIAYQNTRCEADAEEIKQEVFLKVLRYAGDIKDYSRFKYWLVTITHNECKRLFRSNRDKQVWINCIYKQRSAVNFCLRKIYVINRIWMF